MSGASQDSVDADLSGNPLDRTLLMLLMFLGLWVLGSRSRRTIEILSRNKWLVVIYVYLTLSVVWSNFPEITFRRAFRSIGTLMMVLMVLTERDPLEAVRALLRRLYLVHIPLSIAAIKYFRSIGVSYTWDGGQEMWVGLAVHKNNLGQVSMCSGLFFAWQVLQKWGKKKLTLDLALLVMTVWVLCGSKTSHSTTAIIGFLVSGTVLLGLQLIKRRAAHAKRIILTSAVVFLLAAPLIYFAFQAFDEAPTQIVLGASGRDMTFSDRTYLWQDVLDNAARTPILGVGFGAFWVGPIGYELYPFPNWARVTRTWRPGEGHNGYIDLYADLGLVGVAIMLFGIFASISGALDDLSGNFERGTLRLTLLLSVLINNMAESSLLNGTHSMWFIFLLAAINIPTRAKKVTDPAREPAFENYPAEMAAI